MTPKLITMLANYNARTFRADLLAGVTVAMVAIPLSIAIAIASGATPESGLITAIVAGFLISALGGSRVQIGGPTGAFIVVVFGVIAEHGFDGLVLATFMAGIILVIAGYFRFGSLIRLIPEAVIDGFTIGIGVIIASSQLKDFFGLNIAEQPAEFLEKIPALWEARDSLSLTATLAGLATIVLITLLRRAAPRLPGLVLVLALISGGAVWLSLPLETLADRFGALPSHLPTPSLPRISFERVIELLPSALIIAFLAAVESLLSAMVSDRMIGGNHRPNAEILAQGVANIGSALFAGLPATGAIARTATNVNAGGQTPVAGLVHALTILLVLLLAAPLAGYLALPALAALLILTAWNMTEPHKWRDHMAKPRADQALLLVTLVLTVLSDLTVAIGVGVALGLALRLHRGRKDAAKWTPPER
ncbi:SulP family inorganic anion transporter [Rhodobacteraceae bacterium D3-12]|nr:SulP family inorganic anion transporter [Rhodobacteraceae bacterium D3-12]